MVGATLAVALASIGGGNGKASLTIFASRCKMHIDVFIFSKENCWNFQNYFY
jgi:hypothetical protein